MWPRRPASHARNATSSANGLHSLAEVKGQGGNCSHLSPELRDAKFRILSVPPPFLKRTNLKRKCGSELLSHGEI